MKERPIILKPEEVRAILDGRKTQARRIVKPQPLEGVNIDSTWIRPAVIGDQLWVRETFAITPSHGQHRSDGKRWDLWDGLPQRISPDGTQVAYYREAFDRCDPPKWKPPVIMPRWASRILLEVTAVRAERLQDISEADATAEGIESTGDFFECPCWRDYMEPDPNLSSFPDDPVGSYASLWESIYGPDSWAQNPWVWVIEFRRVEP